jgi:DNA-binding response OmpR family regulator
MRILLVEDDLDMAAMLRQVLVTAGASVEIARDGRSGLEEAMRRDYSLIVLDLMLPHLDGLSLCERFRQSRGTTPILMITARDSVSDRIRGLETGADDYLPKPFDVREFLARVRALLRRDRVLRTRHLRVGKLRLDTRRRTAESDEGPLRLTRVEYGLLELLAGNLGKVVSREQLLESVWQDTVPGSNKLEVAMRALRRKLEDAGFTNMIETVYGIGYRIDEAGK